MVKAKVFVLTAPFEGLPKEGDLKLIEEELPPLKSGDFLTEAVYLSVDPYQRNYSTVLKPGSTFIGSQVAIIIESKNPKFPVGGHVFGQFGWRSHTIANDDDTEQTNIKARAVELLPSFDGLPLSLALGALGMPGNTAYFGFLEICQPKAEETVVVTGAAGAVGSHVGQIAKIKGCKTIGIAGSDEKGKWLTEDLGFDHFINYKTQNVTEELKKVAPNGIDCYFDNVGGELSSIVIHQINPFGRISVCGSISSYNDKELHKATVIQSALVFKQLKMEGFLVHRWNNRWNEGVEQNMRWIKEGKLKYQETVTEGFENMFKAFREMLQGVNVGKAIIKV